MAKVAKALAPLCGAILGVLIYVRWLRLWNALAMIVLGLLALGLERFLLTRKTVAAAVVVSMWIFTGIGLTALVTDFLLWMTLHIPQLFPTLPADTLKEVCSVITGALTTFAGVVITKDMKEGGGFFWPGGQFRDHVGKVFSNAPFKLSNGADAYDNAFSDRVGKGGPEGWGFVARLKRAKVLKAWLDANRKQQNTPPPQPPPPPVVNSEPPKPPGEAS